LRAGSELIFGIPVSVVNIDNRGSMVISKTIRSAALTIRRAANVVGVDIHPHSKTNWRWSHNVETYFPVDPISRWGYGKPPHPQIAGKFERQRAEFAELLGRFSQSSEILASVPLEGDRDSSIPYWKNSFFEYLDGAALIAMLNYKAPVRYLEIGSGNSTKFARHAIKGARLPTKIISLDPEPRAQIDTLCDTTIRRRLEDSDLSLFDQLEAGDILFFDGSHRVFTNSRCDRILFGVDASTEAGRHRPHSRHFSAVGLSAEVAKTNVLRAVYACRYAALPQTAFQSAASKLVRLF
jgi:hypothetical protein